MTSNHTLDYSTKLGIPSSLINVNKETYNKYVNDDLKEKYFDAHSPLQPLPDYKYETNPIPLYYIEDYYHHNDDVVDDIQCNGIPVSFLANMIVRCSDKFIRDSWKLPEVIHNEIQCKTPVVLDVLKGLVDSKVLEMINAGDINGAISHVNGIGIQDTTSIVEAVTTTLINDRHNLEALLEYKKNKIFHSFEDKF